MSLNSFVSRFVVILDIGFGFVSKKTMEEYRGKVKIGIIGGSGLYSSGDTTVSTQISVDTPYGKPSDKIHITTVNNHYIAFLSRHGDGHTLNPSEVNYRANIAGISF